MLRPLLIDRKRAHTVRPQRALLQPENILHVIDSARLSHYPAGGADSAAREHVTGHGAVGKFDPFPHADEIDGVLTNDIAATHRLHADLFLAPLANDPFAVAVGDLMIVAPQGLGDHLAHAHSGTTRRILLEFVVHLDNLDV